MDKSTLIPFELLKEPWVLFRDEECNPACVQDECAHRACPLSIGKVVDGQIACPYHGWQYDRTGHCVKMPSTVYKSHININTLPVVERDGFIWVWPGTGTPPIQAMYSCIGMDAWSTVFRPLSSQTCQMMRWW